MISGVKISTIFRKANFLDNQTQKWKESLLQGFLDIPNKKIFCLTSLKFFLFEAKEEKPPLFWTKRRKIQKKV